MDNRSKPPLTLFLTACCQGAFLALVWTFLSTGKRPFSDKCSKTDAIKNLGMEVLQSDRVCYDKLYAIKLCPDFSSWRTRGCHRTENPILKCGFALEMNKPLTECEKSFPLRCGPSMYPRTERRAVTIHLPLTLMEVLLQGFLVS